MELMLLADGKELPIATYLLIIMYLASWILPRLLLCTPDMYYKLVLGIFRRGQETLHDRINNIAY